MKVFAIFLILTAAVGHLEARHWKLDRDCLNAVTPAENCCKLVPRAWWAHLKHPTDCTKFLQCDNGVPVLKDCPAGLHWSIRRDRCEWPHIARCTGAAPTTTTTTPAPTTTTAKTTTSSTTTVSPVPHWSCRNTSAACRHGIDSADDCCAGVPYYHDVLLQNNENCNTYLQCVHGSPMVRPCPAGLQWNAHKCQCDYPSRATCKASPTTTTTAASTTTTAATTTVSTTTVPAAPHWGCHNTSAACRHGIDSAENCCAGVPYYHDVLLQNNENCNTFLQCVHGSPMVRPCPAGLQWNADKCQCDYPSRATCKVTPTTTTTSTAATTPVSTTTVPVTPHWGCRNTSSACRHGVDSADDCCAGVPYYHDVLLQNNKDCNTFLQCVHGSPMVRPCPAGLQWNAHKCQCDYPSRATCKAIPSTTTTVAPTTTPVATTTTAATTTTTSAPPSTLPTGSQCAAGVSSDCRHGRISAKDCCRGVPATIDVLLQNNDQCNTFIQCVHGEPMVRNCAEDFLKWNADLCRCEWADQATCPL